MNTVRLSLEIGLLLQLPTDIEVQTLGDDGNKVRVTFGDLIKGKKVSCAHGVVSSPAAPGAIRAVTLPHPGTA